MAQKIKNCKICRKDDDEPMVQCHSCSRARKKKWVHFTCDAFIQGESQVAGFKEYYCPRCRDSGKEIVFDSNYDPDEEAPAIKNKENNQHSASAQESEDGLSDNNIRPDETAAKRSKRKRLESQNPRPSDGPDYEVEKILKMRPEPQEPSAREFLVQFKGYECPEWVKEKDMTGCFDMLTFFLSEKNLTPAIHSVVGANLDDDKEHNIENWVSSQRILECISSYSRKAYSKPIDVVLFNSEVVYDQDVIAILLVGNHCVVALILNDEGMAYVADGGSHSLKNAQFRLEIAKTIGLPVKALAFHQQTHIDHCASSAVAIALEFKRLYQDLDAIGTEIRVAKWRLAQIKKAFHKSHSEKETKELHFIQYWNRFKCPNCPSSFTNKQKLGAHRRFCS